MASKVAMEKLSALMSKGSEKMLKEIAEEFSVDQSTIWRALRRLNIRRKKTTRYAEARFYEKGRRRFLSKLYKYHQEQKDIVFIDETGFAPSSVAHARMGCCRAARLR